MSFPTQILPDHHRHCDDLFVAAGKKQELEQGRKTMEQMQQNIGKATEQTQQSTERAEDAAK